MPQSLARIHIHLVFSTKNRVTHLGDDTRDSLHRYLATILKDRGCRVTSINSVEDHVHLLFELGRTVSVSSVVEDLKKHSSRWLKTEMGAPAAFAWQAGYGAFSASESHVHSVAHYVADQREHHRKRSFQEEFRALCAEHGVEFDERYMWD